ncbi:hypothetical protein EDB92DRAFT_1812377 [Lactarius akahatsu]|uniref:Uncharacterized protein n=1 Tax=Lactarius akahatsu TaxID=416441 RepID=A0AAD4LTF8_9AGAM|nr:hypothetical protein EDB92DRAFT_1812377 [Lactarius akahatsu]
MAPKEPAQAIPSPAPPTTISATPAGAAASQGTPGSSNVPTPSPPAPVKGKEAQAVAPNPAPGDRPAPASPLARVDDPASFPPLPAPSVPAAGPSGNATGTGSRTADKNDGFLSVGRRGPSYNIVSAKAIQQQTASLASAKATAAAQNRTPQGRPKPSNPQSRNVTKVVVIRHGGLEDLEAEKALRDTPPGNIIHQVRCDIERSTSNPIKLLGGTWTKEVAKTGNFAYTITGKVSMDRILTFSNHLLAPFPGGTLVPTEGWCWAHLREDVTKMNSATGTVIFVYIDPTGKITQEAIAGGISMFSFGIKFVFAGDSPRLKQCGRCFEVGHNTGAATCKWLTRSRCFKCGKNYYGDEHDFFCQVQQKESGKCDCKPTCIACGKAGHHARTWRGCLASGDFPSPRQAKKLESTTVTAPPASAPAPPPRSILRRPTELDTPSPPEPSLFDPAMPAAEMTASSLPAEAVTPAPKPKPRPKARIVTPASDTAKPGKTSTERAAKRPRPASPSSVQGPLAPALTKVRGDTSPSKELPWPRSMPNLPCFMQEEIKSQHITTTVDGVWYDCPIADLAPAFHTLRNMEIAFLLRVIMDDEWERLVEEHAPVLCAPPRSAVEIDTVLDLLYNALNKACDATTKRKGHNKARAERWWNAECAAAAQDVRDAVTEVACSAAARSLKTAIRAAKREWADQHISATNVWEVAAWRHGRSVTQIPALKDADGDLQFDHAQMAGIFGGRFFAKDRGDISDALPGTPLPDHAAPMTL